MQENQRVRLTKRLLKDSLVELMAQKSIREISIRELCENAGVNRSTFYSHYESEIDLLEDLVNDISDEINKLFENDINDYSYKVSYRIEKTCKYLKQRDKAVKALFSDNVVNYKFVRALFEKSDAYVKTCDDLTKKYGEDSKNIILTGIITGVFSMLKYWLENDESISPRELGVLVEKMFNGSLLNFKA